MNEKTKIVLLNGAEFLTDIALHDLYVMWQAVKKGQALIKVEVCTMDGIHDIGLDLRRLDPDRTFGDAIIAAYPSIAPPCPVADTERPPAPS